MSEQPKDCRDHDYIVSGLLLDRMMTNADNDELESILFARPHPTSARKEKCCKGCEADMCAEACQTWINEHDAATARKAREELLTELGRQCAGRTKSQMLDIMAEFKYQPEKYLESLQQQAGKP